MSTWHEYTVGLTRSWQFNLTEKDMKSFSKLSGDLNPIHTCTGFAQKKGFDSTLIYGVLLCAQFSKLVGEELPDKNSILTGFKVNFHKPAYINQLLFFSAVLINISESTYALEFHCEITNPKHERICSATINAVWRE